MILDIEDNVKTSIKNKYESRGGSKTTENQNYSCFHFDFSNIYIYIYITLPVRCSFSVSLVIVFILAVSNFFSAINSCMLDWAFVTLLQASLFSSRSRATRCFSSFNCVCKSCTRSVFLSTFSVMVCTFNVLVCNSDLKSRPGNIEHIEHSVIVVVKVTNICITLKKKKTCLDVLNKGDARQWQWGTKEGGVIEILTRCSPFHFCTYRL